MATVVLSFAQAGGIGANGAYMPVASKPLRTETVTSSGTTAAGSIVAQRGDFVTVFCDTAVIANCGAAASASAGKYCPAGIPTDIYPAAGDVIHVIDA